MKEDKKKVEVTLQPISTTTIKVKIKGKSDLISDKFPESAKELILQKQTGVTKGNKKKTRDINQEVEDALHKTSKGKIGFPADGFKAGMMESTSFVGDKMFSKKLVSGAVKIINTQEGLVPIQFKKQYILKHNIEHNTKFSPAFQEWSCELEILYDSNNISAQDILTLLNYAGFYIGIGAWRPKCKCGGSGAYGMYEVSLPKKKQEDTK